MKINVWQIMTDEIRYFLFVFKKWSSTIVNINIQNCFKITFKHNLNEKGYYRHLENNIADHIKQ